MADLRKQVATVEPVRSKRPRNASESLAYTQKRWGAAATETVNKGAIWTSVLDLGPGTRAANGRMQRTFNVYRQGDEYLRVMLSGGSATVYLNGYRLAEIDGKWGVSARKGGAMMYDLRKGSGKAMRPGKNVMEIVGQASKFGLMAPEALGPPSPF